MDTEILARGSSRPRMSPAFSLFWAARTISLVGDGLVNVALVFAVVSLGGSAVDIGAVLGVSMVVRVALTLIGGVLADRLPRRRMLLTSDLAQAAVQFGMAALLLSGSAELWMLLTASVAYGAASAVYRPALTGIVPEVVGAGGADAGLRKFGAGRRDAGRQNAGSAGRGMDAGSAGRGMGAGHQDTSRQSTASDRQAPGLQDPAPTHHSQLQRANALLGLSQSVSRVIGPLLAGALVALAGPGWVYAIDGATFLVSAVLLAALRLPSTQVGLRKRNLWADLTTGWREVRSRRWYLTGLLVHAAYNLASAPFYVLGPLLVGGASMWGVVSAAGAVGAVAGALLATRWHPERPLSVSHLLLTSGAAPLLALAADAAPWAVGCAAALGMLGASYVNAVWATTVQRMVPGELMSRVSSYDWLVSLLSLPAGYALAGRLAEGAGEGGVLTGAALLLVLVAVPAAFVPAVRAVGQPSPVKGRPSHSR